MGSTAAHVTSVGLSSSTPAHGATTPGMPSTPTSTCRYGGTPLRRKRACGPLDCSLRIFPDVLSSHRAGNNAIHVNFRTGAGIGDNAEAIIGALRARASAGNVPVPGNRVPFPVHLNAHLNNSSDSRTNDVINPNNIVPELGFIGTHEGQIADIVGNRLDGPQGTNRQAFNFVAVLEYSCDCSPKPELFWFINRQDAHTNFSPDPSIPGAMPPVVRAQTYRSPENGRGGYKKDRYGRLTPKGPGEGGLCFISAADSPTVLGSFIIVGRVTWTTPEGLVRCVRMKKITIDRYRRLSYNGPASAAEEANIATQLDRMNL